MPAFDYGTLKEKGRQISGVPKSSGKFVWWRDVLNIPAASGAWLADILGVQLEEIASAKTSGFFKLALLRGLSNLFHADTPHVMYAWFSVTRGGYSGWARMSQ